MTDPWFARSAFQFFVSGAEDLVQFALLGILLGREWAKFMLPVPKALLTLMLWMSGTFATLNLACAALAFGLWMAK